MEAFIGWWTAVQNLLPDHSLWVNGSFTTYKATAPNDIDVVIVTKASVVNSITPDKQEELRSLLTFQESENGPRIQPMGGLVDAFISFRGNPDDTAYWFNLWQQVKDDPSARKGFLVVKPDV